MDYWSDENHKNWLSHYTEGRFNHAGKSSQFLVFTKEFRDKLLPPGVSQHNHLICNLLDTDSGIVYTMPMYAAFEENGYILDSEYQSVDGFSLMSYFYEEHHCPCHRHTDAVSSGLRENDGTDDFECEGQRFLIQSITPKDSKLILYSETMSEEELEEILSKSCA